MAFCRGNPESNSHTSIRSRAMGKNGSMIRKVLVDKKFEVGLRSEVI